MGGTSAIDVLTNLVMDDKMFVGLLGNVVGEGLNLQNNPPQLNAQEDLAVKHIVDMLRPLSSEKGGPLIIKPVSFKSGRSNLILEYPGTSTDPNDIVSFVGSHLDVVQANEGDWEFPPFQLTFKGDELRGRGTTDCLGNVSLIAELFRQLGEKRPALKRTVVAIFIANEESQESPEIGAEGLMKEGYFDKLKGGPLYWIDVADSQPCIGTAGMLVWTLQARGRLFHSGMPNLAINAIELASEALKVIQTRFYKDYPPHKKEAEYFFEVPSTMKPTQWSFPGGGVNQIPGECTITGDCRITPFYSVREVATKLKSYVSDINENITDLDVRGPVSKYVLPDGLRGSLDIEFAEGMAEGVAMNLESPGFLALEEATKRVLGIVKPFSLTGSLPLIRDLQDDGFDVQAVGYGLMETYHASNEFCLHSDFQKGFKVLANLIAILEG